MKNRIYRNYFWVAFITILIVSFVFVLSYNRTIHEQKEAGMREEAEFMEALLTNEPGHEPFAQAAKSMDFRITLIEADGTVSYDNKVENVSGMENHGNRPEIRYAKEHGEGSSSRISNTLQSETYYYALKMKDGRILRLSSEGVSIWEAFRRILPLLAGVAVLILIIAFFVAHRLTNDIVKVINGIDLEEPLKQVGLPELAILQKRLDSQNQKIRLQLRSLQEQERKLTAITENMNEGLIMLSNDRHILYMNQSCRNLFDVSGMDFTGQHIASFCGSNQMNEVVDAALGGAVYTAVQEVNERKVQYFGNPILESKKVQGIIILVLDITERERTEKMRKEFSANVSHELKTPLTSISGFAELMENNMVRPEDVPVFSGRIRQEASRLLNLVNDIIKVSQLDDKEVYYTRENIDLLELALEIRSRLEPMAERHEVAVIVEGGHLQYLASKQMMNDLLYNLMENGIKYNKQGGKLWVEIRERKDRPSVSVRDTGIGIPMKYQSRVFERFFRVDKSHSKQTGGTGLGLSIVKHVVEYCGGYIEIHSTVGEGTEIITYL